MNIHVLKECHFTLSMEMTTQNNTTAPNSKRINGFYRDTTKVKLVDIKKKFSEK